MGESPAFSRIKADFLALQANVERAGYALACPYGSSDEFEAAVIRSKLSAGVYGPKRRRRHILHIVSAAGAAAALGLILLMI